MIFFNVIHVLCLLFSNDCFLNFQDMKKYQK